MRKLLLNVVLFVFGAELDAQDLILTAEGKLLIVQIARMDSEYTFYRGVGERELIPISNTMIKFYNWNTRNIPVNGYQIYEYRDEIVTRDMAGNRVLLKQQKPKVAKKVSRLALGGMLGFALFANASSSKGSWDGIEYVALAALSGTVAIVSGVVHLVMSKVKGENNYELKQNKYLGFETYGTAQNQLLKQPYSKNVNLSFVSQGLGVQLSF